LSVEGHADTALYISIVEGTHSVRHASWVGRTVPLDTSAAGHALRGRVPAEGYVIVERGVEADVTAIACPVHSEARIVAALSLDKVALRRRIGYVVRNAGLFPHRTGVDNVAALPRLLGGGKKETRSNAMELLERVGLDAKFAKRYAWQLSGGQQQRVGVARAL